MTEYHNPQQDPGSEKRLLVAFLLVFVMIAVMQLFIRKQQPPTPPEKPAATPLTQGQQSPPPTATASPATTPAAAKTKSTAPKITVKQAAAESEAVLENNDYRVVLTNHGAVAESWVLKGFKDNDGNPLDLVNKTAAPMLGFPLSLFLYDKELEKKVNSALYVATATTAADGTQSVTFEYSDGTVSARKVLRARKNGGKNFVLDVETEVTNNGQRVQAFPQWPSGMGDQSTVTSYTNGKIDWEQDGKIEHKAAVSGSFITGKKYISNGQTVSGPFEWVGTADQYFAAVFMPESPRDTAAITLNNSIDLPRDPKKPDEGPKDKVSVIGVAAGSVNGLTRVRIFAGPKTLDVIEQTQSQPGGPDLRGLTDFGMFSFIARPLFLWLRWTYEHWIPNWGWAIAFLTVVITMALLPLRISSMKSSLKMQKIQPQMKALQEKYKRYSLTDPRRADMQKEMQELYKREGVNPVGGCLPLVLQMPFLFAFYSMLANAIELRQASWVWVRDLSAPDPLHILPVVIIILMFLSQKSMPQAGMDPAQQKILTFMGPVMFGFLSWNTPAGLSVYWAISTLLGYVQQIIINRSALGQQVRKSMERRTTRKK
ncbi:MAG TPA: membrane protein insertase YidC [Candidatus Angelobacter sp.]|nr:membrane protein insertase YidC [Candidatus Angelobacter sp.]